ncbi:hypothetical protein [Pelomonas sp. Root1444]|uniref:hypothetical protein n=1 Tax=Pelomonas sp. Root1444 TaxID=1736464 RepID=UPI000703319E|nr:hypothetical protein [Pelomonas sp. Root1444]KQY85352.1 hypothetical protein ASD35_22265 [Pelomonas sp. Root1444]
MNAAQFSQIMLAPWRQRDRSAPWGRRLIAALAVIAMVASLIWLPPAAAWRVPVGIVIVVVHGLWIAVGASLLEQNHPHAAHGVPGHLRALRRAALLGWALCSGLTTLLAWLIVPDTVHWGVLLLGNSLVVTFLLWTARLWWLWLLLAFQSPLAGVFAGKLTPLWNALAALWQANPHGMLLLALLVQAWLVTTALGDGGTKHQALYARQAQRRNVMRMMSEGRQPTAASWGRPIEWLFSPLMHLFSAWQRRLLARADNTRQRSVMARAEIVLHGQQHWLKQLMALGTIATLTLLSFSAVCFIYDISLATIFQHGAIGMSIGLASAGLSPGFALPASLWQSRREQALLRLLPGMPQGTTLNRAVAARQLRDFGFSWAFTSLALLALAKGTDNSLPLYLPLAALPVAALALTRRPATLRAPTALAGVLPSLALLALAGLLYLLHQLGTPPWAVATPVCAVAVALLAWRWRRLVAAPTALPAGRLG